MTVNFYYFFPNDCIIHNCKDASFLHSADLLFEKFKKEYKEITFNKINVSNHITKIESIYLRKGYFYVNIENPENGKYFFISYWDRLYEVQHWGEELKNCVEILAATGVQKNHRDFEECGVNYTPISLMPLNKTAIDHIEIAYKNKKTIRERPFFRGTIYLNRSWIKLNDKRFDITDGHLDSIAYTEELANNLLNLDLIAINRDSFRFQDILGVESCSLSVKRIVKTHNPLIPNYHYALVDVDDISDQKKVADAYMEKYEYLKKNEDEARWIAKNGREWYINNCTLEAHTNILKNVINLDKLK